MSDATPADFHTGAEDVAWNLADLYATEDDLGPALERADEEAERFSSRCRGHVEALSSAALADALGEYERLQNRMDRAYTYAFLNWCSDTNLAATGALLQRVQEQYTRIGQKILFFELELLQIPEERMAELIKDSNLAGFRHYLETLQLRKNHVLTEPEEKVIAEKSVTGINAWVRYFDETLSDARFEFRGKHLTEQQVLSKLYDANRDTRREAALAMTAGLRRHLRSITYVFNTVLNDKASEDRMRGYPHWLTSRNLSNEISDQSVDALIEAVTSRYELVSRYYTLKRKQLGLDQMFDYDRYAPVAENPRRFTWSEAQELVQASYQKFHPRAGEIAARFFEERWIDAAPRQGKRGGAFSHRAVTDVHPYILVNFMGNPRDVQTLAHELGHGIHQYLSRVQGSLQCGTPLTTAETASVFGEMLVFDELMARETDPESRLAMVMGKIDDALATVFRQVTMNRFEDRIHTLRRTQGEISAEQFSQNWIETQNDMYLDSVQLGDHYRLWWSYIPHFIHAPGYVYAYAFGELLVLALYSLYRNEANGFAEQYLGLLEAGGSDWPHVLVGRLGVNLQDPAFWRQGLGEIENMIVRAEEMAEGLDR